MANVIKSGARNRRPPAAWIIDANKRSELESGTIPKEMSVSHQKH